MEGFERILNHWELRFLVILSVALQMVLIIWACNRKRISSQPIRRILWLVIFLAADFLATLSLGAIFHISLSLKESGNKYLLALWAPFILLHLSKHSRVTTFSLSENEFWLGHLIRFIYHEGIAILICIEASKEKRVESTSIILFISATLRLGERVLALKRGSMNELRNSTFKKADPGLHIHDIERLATLSREANIRGQFEHAIPIPNDNNEVQPHIVPRRPNTSFLCAAYRSFHKYKGVYIDPIFVKKGMRKYGQAFKELDLDDAFALIEMELSFAYDLFYTKSALFHTRFIWFPRIISLISIFFAWVIFYGADKRGFLPVDVSIAYLLLTTTLILEVWSFLESMFSNHALVVVGFREGKIWRCMEEIIYKCSINRDIQGNLHFGTTPSQMGQFSLLSFSFHDSRSWSAMKWFRNYFEVKDVWNNYWYASYLQNDNMEDLKDHIFHVVRRRLENEERHLDGQISNISLISSEVSLKMLENRISQENIKREFEECLLVWHIATDLCFRHVTYSPNLIIDMHLQYAKYISDYMLYLLATQPTMLSPLTTELTSYRNACAASIQFYSDHPINNDEYEVYEILMRNNINYNRIPAEEKLKHNTLLWDGCKLASELGNLSSANFQIWGLVFEVWVDMLSFTAIKTAGKFHAERLGAGGEFITHVWLFMVHSIMGSHYNI